MTLRLSLRCVPILMRRWGGLTVSVIPTAICRIRTSDIRGSRQPRLEGFTRRNFSCRWPTGKGPIALVEAQVYVFAAKYSIVRCARRLGFLGRVAQIEASALKLKQRFETSIRPSPYSLRVLSDLRACFTWSAVTGAAALFQVLPI